ncbi:hypothetical protein Bint_0198 [Brachyspira intermedia PWS/A]|uniref:Peptidase M30, hyicolysin n=1 Tax=Brachyspira intermedia (strain ATCC 51140 / PWS/A) TaxID=1045858 RepID=G0EQC7_BRAIP|nr:hypothetical protein [Brachyspira intermedia]AEM20832.1 hypothetical protein Bint_0198 [Brachyspira intermedia PWS/A]
MKNIYIFLFAILMFIISCNKPTTSPSEPISEIINGITYYDPATAETKEYPFFRIDNVTGQNIFVKNTFKKLAVSKNAIIYLEQGINTITKDKILSFITKFEEYYPREVEIYGQPSDFDGNGKIIFLMANLNTNTAGGSFSTGGYFNPLDLSIGKGGIAGEYLHIDVGNNIDYGIGIMMHELQHLINKYVNGIKKNKAMDIWLDEALSESTSHMFDKEMVNMRAKAFNDTPYYSFYSWYFQYSKNNDIFTKPMYAASYAPVSMFMKWVDAKTGNNQEIYKKIASSSLTDSEQILLDSVKTLAPSLGNDMDTLLINWIKGINNGDIKDISNAPNISDLASSKSYEEFLINGQTQLLPKALIVCSKQDSDKITDSNIRKEDLGNGNYIVLNTRKNASAGFTSASDIVPISLTRTAVRNNNVSELTMFKKDYFTDIVITE